eukprot:TRINITY_DN27200_c0_g1_i1.p1 TRINITY_DN27200_c0_g1~~TRINITY_DN27200_c0_g1_i1.p1  ORF type:complete len:548 (+),score=172.55 TRINITY_DN27200_c0_g1_i1:52-1695(+)
MAFMVGDVVIAPLCAAHVGDDGKPMSGVIIASNFNAGAATVFFSDGTVGNYGVTELALNYRQHALPAGESSPMFALNFIEGVKYAAALKEDYVTAQRCKEALLCLKLEFEQNGPKVELCQPLSSNLFERQLATKSAFKKELTLDFFPVTRGISTPTELFSTFQDVRAGVFSAYPQLGAEYLDALTLLRMYRTLCGASPAATVLAQDLIERAQAGAELLATTDTLAKSPEKPAAWTREQYNLGLQGTNGSLAMRIANRSVNPAALPLHTVVHAMMNDSGRAGAAVMAHRRWLLAPGLAQTGFGQSGTVSTVYSYAASQNYHCLAPFVALPPAGCFPVEWFDSRMYWSCQLNPMCYLLGSDIRVRVCPVVKGTRQENIVHSEVVVSEEEHGTGPCVVFQPEGIPAEGGVYEVEISGIFAMPNPSVGELKVEESITPDGLTILTVSNTTLSTKYILKYTFHGNERFNPLVEPLSESVVAGGAPNQFRIPLNPGQTSVPFVRGLWHTIDKVHASGPPDCLPCDPMATTIVYTTTVCASGLPPAELRSEDLR